MKANARDGHVRRVASTVFLFQKNLIFVKKKGLTWYESKRAPRPRQGPVFFSVTDRRQYLYYCTSTASKLDFFCFFYPLGDTLSPESVAK